MILEVILFIKISIFLGDNQKWVKSIQRKIHEHDVHALTLCDNRLYSGGADSYLACSFHPPKTLLKLPPIILNPCAYVAQEARFLMLRHPKYLEIWRLGIGETSDSSYRGLVNIKKPPQKLLELQRYTRVACDEQEKEGILYSCISNDGKWIFCSTNLGNKLHNFVWKVWTIKF